MDLKLIFVVTRQCNFRCSYCPIDKQEINMPLSMAKESIDFISHLNYKFKHVKFFGGEPLLKKDIIKYFINNFPYASSFYITTNTYFMNADFFEFSISKSIFLNYSVDGNYVRNSDQRTMGNLSQAVQIDNNIKNYNHHNITINQCISPTYVKNFFKDFLYIYSLGYKKFNFLPSYFCEWPKDTQYLLIREYQKIKKFAFNNKLLLDIPNEYNNVTYNMALVIDTNGDIFLSDIFLIKEFSKYREHLIIGNIKKEFNESLLSNDQFILTYGKYIESIISIEYSENVITSSLKIAKISNFFLRTMQEYKTTYA